MADENWDTEPIAGLTDGVESMPLPPAADLPEIKLFGRWSCEDVQVADMSLQVFRLFCLDDIYLANG
ncbi:unnamed protein product, partial [Nesidiocoris tenuis]